MENICGPVISAVISAIISAIVSFIMMNLNTKNAQRRQLDEQLDSIIKISIQYPYFELRSFTDSWKQDSAADDEKYA